MLTVRNKVWAEARLYSPTQNGELLEALMLYHEACEEDSNATLIWHSISQATLLIFFYCAPVEKPPVFECFYNIPFLARVIEPAFNTIYGVVQGLANVLADEPLMFDAPIFRLMQRLILVGMRCERCQACQTWKCIRQQKNAERNSLRP